MFNRPITWRISGIAAGGLAACLALAACNGSATQTTTGKGIEGVLVDPHGNPVPGATIKAWPSGYGPRGGAGGQDSGRAVSAQTDERGHYALDGLEVGIYNLIGSDPAGRGAVLIPRVKYLEQAADLGTDTLKAPGVIVGQVRADGANPPLAFCYLEGSNYAAITDAAGRFTLPGLAEGEYRLNYFANGYLLAADSAVIVRSGDTATLAAKTLVPDLDLQPPGPAGAAAVYDSVYGVVHLSWRRVHAGDLKGYVIETQNDSGSNEHFAHSWEVSDTLFDEDMMAQFGIFGGHGPGFTRKYWIRAKDTEGNLSPKGEPLSVRITDPAIFRTRFTVRAVPDSAASGQCLDTLGLALDVTESPDSLVPIRWRAKGYYRNEQTAPGSADWNTAYDSIGVSKGAPHRDTLIFTHESLGLLEAIGPNAVFDSVLVSATLAVGGTLVRMVTVPVALDSLGCFHPRPTRTQTDGKLPF